MTARVVFHGMREWDAAMDRLVVHAFGACKRGADNAAKVLAAETQRQLSRTTHRAGTPTPSRPGQPPSLVSGTLRRSVKIVPAVQVGRSAWVAKVGPTAAYARVQELGGDTGTSVLPARPYLAPALAQVIGDGTLWAAFRAGWERF